MHNGPANSPFAQKLSLGWVIVDLLRHQWRQVQSLANTFCTAGIENTSLLYSAERHGLQTDVALLEDDQARRSHWPTGVVKKTFPSSDGRVANGGIGLVLLL